MEHGEVEVYLHSFLTATLGAQAEVPTQLDAGRPHSRHGRFVEEIIFCLA